MADKDTTQEFSKAEILAAIAASERRIIAANESRIAQMERMFLHLLKKVFGYAVGQITADEMEKAE